MKNWDEEKDRLADALSRVLTVVIWSSMALLLILITQGCYLGNQEAIHYRKLYTECQKNYKETLKEWEECDNNLVTCEEVALDCLRLNQ